jgi:hypothetical protein
MNNRSFSLNLNSLTQRTTSLSKLPSQLPSQLPATRERAPSLSDRLRSLSPRGEKPVPPVRFPSRLPTIVETPSKPKLDPRGLLHQVGVDLNKVLPSAESNWAEIVQAAEGVFDGDPVELVSGSKLPELLVRFILNAVYAVYDEDAPCQLICRFHPSARPEALLLLTSRLASGPMPPSSKLQKAVKDAVRETCTYFVKTQQTDKLLRLLRLCPEQFRPPALSGHALFWAPDTCPGLLLEYATRGWDAQLATTMQLIQESDPKEHLCKLATLASMFFAHRDDDPKYSEMYTGIAFGICNSVGEAFKGNEDHLKAFLAKLSPQLSNEVLPPPDPGRFEDRSLADKKWPAPAQLQLGQTPEQLRERLHRETGITLTSTGWFVPLPQQWDGLLTYLRDAALLNPADPELVNLADAACAFVYLTPPFTHNVASMVKKWLLRLGDMGSGPEVDQLRTALSNSWWADA